MDSRVAPPNRFQTLQVYQDFVKNQKAIFVTSQTVNETPPPEKPAEKRPIQPSRTERIDPLAECN